MLAPTQPGTFCYDNTAKMSQSRATRRFFREASKRLPQLEFKTHFNPSGVAVWGETYAHIFRDGKPVIEAYDTRDGILVRQWDGDHSGHNHYAHTLLTFVEFVETLAQRPFVRF